MFLSIDIIIYSDLNTQGNCKVAITEKCIELSQHNSFRILNHLAFHVYLSIGTKAEVFN